MIVVVAVKENGALQILESSDRVVAGEDRLSTLLPEYPDSHMRLLNHALLNIKYHNSIEIRFSLLLLYMHLIYS